MDTAEDVIRIRRILEKLMSPEHLDVSGVMQLLNQLKSLSVTLEILQKTHIGVTINNLRKRTTDESLNNLARLLIKKWKKLMHVKSDVSDAGHRTSKRCRSSSASSSMSATSTGSTCDSGDGTVEDLMHTGEVSCQSPPDIHKTRYGPVFQLPEASVVDDPVRSKCRELLSSALRVKPVPDNAISVDDFAAAVEDCVFKEFTSTDMKYKNRIRSRVANIRDPKNPHLRESILFWGVQPEQLASMTADEMASDEMRQERACLAKEAFNDHQLALVLGTETDQFKCNACKKHNTTYSELQTTNPEEPLTALVLCNDCGNRWKLG